MNDLGLGEIGLSRDLTSVFGFGESRSLNLNFRTLFEVDVRFRIPNDSACHSYLGDNSELCFYSSIPPIIFSGSFQAAVGPLSPSLAQARGMYCLIVAASLSARYITSSL